MSNKNSRYAICVYYDPNGQLQKFMEYFLLSLTELCSKVLLVVNGKLNEDFKNKTATLGVEILQRENKGYDFSAYKEGYLFLKHHHQMNVNELVFCNSSCYGPITSLKTIFEAMNKKDNDFWGLTQWHGTPWPDHIQSYFLVFRKSVFTSVHFERYWETLPEIADRREAIVKCEVLLTDFFEKKGFKWDTFIKPVRHEFCMTNVYEGLKKGQPLIKRKFFLLSQDIAEKKRVYEFLTNKTRYDVGLIHEDFFLTSCLSSSKKIKSLKNFVKVNYPKVSKILITIKHLLWTIWYKIIV